MRRPSLTLCAALFACLLAGPSLAQSFGELGPFAKLIDDRPMSEAERAYKGEANLTEAQRAKIKTTLKEGAVKVKAYLDDPANKADLEKNGGNMVYAMSLMGFEEIVEVLLAYPEVRQRLNSPTMHGTSLWAMAALAMPHSNRICGNPKAQAKSIQLLGAYYGTDPAASPFPRIRQQLEDAGATPKPNETRDLWSKLCLSDPYSDNASASDAAARRRIADAPDTLTAILAEMAR
jgi:hypothetical protein